MASLLHRFAANPVSDDQDGLVIEAVKDYPMDNVYLKFVKGKMETTKSPGVHQFGMIIPMPIR